MRTIRAALLALWVVAASSCYAGYGYGYGGYVSAGYSTGYHRPYPYYSYAPTYGYGGYGYRSPSYYGRYGYAPYGRYGYAPYGRYGYAPNYYRGTTVRPHYYGGAPYRYSHPAPHRYYGGGSYGHPSRYGARPYYR